MWACGREHAKPQSESRATHTPNKVLAKVVEFNCSSTMDRVGTRATCNHALLEFDHHGVGWTCTMDFADKRLPAMEANGSARLVRKDHIGL